jgi:predicted metal-dependent peptidase
MACFRVPGVGKPATLFFTTLLLRLAPAADWSVPTFATDGRKLFFNPDAALRLSRDELFGVLTHEVYHVAMAHHARKGARDLSIYNVACDLAINPVILAAGFALPAGALEPGKGDYQSLPPGLSAEAYYDLLTRPGQGGEGGDDEREAAPRQGRGEDDDPVAGGEDDAPPGQEEEGEGEGGGAEDGAPPGEEAGGGADDAAPPPREAPDPGGCGGVIEPPRSTPAELKGEEARSQVALAQAYQAAKSMGSVPAWLERLVEAALQPREGWRETLREFVSRHARQEHSWSRPNRRFAQQGVHLPSLQGEGLGDVIVTVDCSGSISQRELDVFAGEIQGILETYECSLLVLYHDVPVTSVQKWAPGDGPLKLRPRGGGGTSHVPVFEWIAGKAAVEAPDAPCVVCFTDMETTFPDKAPALPVLWCAYGHSRYFQKPPFGRVVEIRGD